MAKMFYTIEEVCEKLGKSEDQVKDMVSSGQIQEFRDRDKLMFKVEQIDLLAGGDDEGDVHLDLESSGSAPGLDLASSGLDLKDDSALGLTDSHESEGLGGMDDAEATAADTQITDAIGDDDLSLEAVGSGSGLLDLTQDSDDTSLGAELLEEVYSSDENIEIPANASGLFEAAGAESPANAMAGGGATIPMMAEVYDGTGSGMGVGLLIVAAASLVLLAFVTWVGQAGATSALAIKMSGNVMMWGGGLLIAAIVCGLVGMFIGKASE